MIETALRLLNLDKSTATGRLVLTLMARSPSSSGLMLERKREGIAKAKAAGKY